MKHCTIKDRYLLTKTGSTRCTWHIALKASNLTFNVGDSIAIYPTNSIDVVEKILSILQVDKSSTIFEKKSKEPCRVFEYLLNKANLSKIPPSLLRLAHERCLDTIQKTKLKTLMLPENKSQMNEYLASFELWDFLALHSNFTIQEVIDKLLPMMPRFYSIASCPLTTPEEIHLIVAHVTYNTSGHIRHGIGSDFLCNRAIKDEPIPFYIQPSHGFNLPRDTSTDIIMIGPGTGVAPFKAFIEQRYLQKATGKNWLFFGERNKKTDFYYEEFFSSFVNKGFLQIDTAFSRDQVEKIYVQDLLMKKGKKITHLLENGANFYVCGDAKKMAKDVDLALHHIIKFHKNLTEEETKTYIKNLRLSKRYLIDVY